MLGVHLLLQNGALLHKLVSPCRKWCSVVVEALEAFEHMSSRTPSSPSRDLASNSSFLAVWRISKFFMVKSRFWWRSSLRARRSCFSCSLRSNVASTPLVSDWVALSQALLDVEAVWRLGNGHQTSVVVVLACTLKADDLVVLGHAALDSAVLLVGPNQSGGEGRQHPRTNHCAPRSVHERAK